MNAMNPMTMSPQFSPNDRVCDCRGPHHKVPRMPIMIDQEKADPMDIRDLMGTPLHTVIDPDSINGKMLQIFTNKEQAKEFALAIPKRKPSAFLNRKRKQETKQTATNQQALTAGVPPDGGYLDLYEHIDFRGCNWRLLEWNSHTVGNYGNLWACGFLWWGWKNANNIVSSMDVRVSADLVTFFDAPNLDYGNFSNTLWVPGDAWVPNLVPHGWNDRISSHMLWYLSR